MITAEHLTKRYGARTVVDDVSFTARPGRVTGFLGPNGAGKSTTMRMVCALTTPTGGSATVLGRPYRDLTDPGRHVAWLQDLIALGFDEVYLHHVGQEQTPWLEVFGEKVLPELDVTTRAGAA